MRNKYIVYIPFVKLISFYVLPIETGKINDFLYQQIEKLIYLPKQTCNVPNELIITFFTCTYSNILLHLNRRGSLLLEMIQKFDLRNFLIKSILVKFCRLQLDYSQSFKFWIRHWIARSMRPRPNYYRTCLLQFCASYYILPPFQNVSRISL